MRTVLSGTGTPKRVTFAPGTGTYATNQSTVEPLPEPQVSGSNLQYTNAQRERLNAFQPPYARSIPDGEREQDWCQPCPGQNFWLPKYKRAERPLREWNRYNKTDEYARCMNDRYTSGLQKRTSCWRCGMSGHVAAMHRVATEGNWIHICKGIHARLIENQRSDTPDESLPPPSEDGMYPRSIAIEGSEPRQFGGSYRGRSRGRYGRSGRGGYGRGGYGRGGYNQGPQNNISEGAVLAMFKKMFEEHVGSLPQNNKNTTTTATTPIIEQESEPTATKASGV